MDKRGEAMYIRYNNTRNECNQVYRYLYKKKISLLKLRVVVYSILGGVGMYMAMYTLVDYIYKIFFSILFTTILFIAGLKQMTKQINKEVDTIINDELIELVVEKNFIKIKSKEKEYSLLINKEENYRFLEICRNIVLVNKNSKIVFIIPERAFKDITEKEQFLNEIKLKIEIWQKRNLFKLRFLFCVFEIV